MPSTPSGASKDHRSKKPEMLTAAERRRVSKMNSPYRDMFGEHRGAGQPPRAVRRAARNLQSRGNAADKVLAERRAMTVLRTKYWDELVDIYESELSYIEAGGE